MMVQAGGMTPVLIQQTRVRNNQQRMYQIRGGGGKNNIIDHPATSVGYRVESVWQQQLRPALSTWKDQLVDVSSGIYERSKRMARKSKRKIDAMIEAAARAATEDEETKSSSTSKTTAPMFTPRGNNNNNNKNNLASSIKSTPSSSSSSSSMSIPSLFVPSRIIKISILAVLIGELLDRIGILYEQDAPAIFEARIHDFWIHTVEPKLIRIKERIQLFYWNRIEPHLPPWIVHAIDDCMYYGTNPLASLVGANEIPTTKVAFVIGTSIGMILSPIIINYTYRYWKLFVAVYGVAEINHRCKRSGHKFVHWLGETPNTLGTSLDGILEQCRQLIRRIFFGRKELQTSYYYDNSSNGPMHVIDDDFYRQQQQQQIIPLLGGGDEDAARRKKEDDGTTQYTLGISSSSSSDGVSSSSRNNNKKKKKKKKKGNNEESDFHGLLDEFRNWMVVQNHDVVVVGRRGLMSTTRYHHHRHDGYENEEYNNEKRKEMIKRGFLLGCALGLAVVRIL
jgi:hypothetical protein